MMRSGLFRRIFLGGLVVGLGSVLAVGLVTRVVFTRAFEAYLLTLPGMRGPGMGQGRIAVAGAAEQAFLTSVDRGMILGGALAAVFAALTAYLLARSLAEPLQRLEEASASLAAGDLTHRVAVDGPDEMISLGRSFNAMADALEEAERLRRRLSADVAHELRNPLTALRVQAEGMAEGVIPVEEGRLRSLLEDVEHLTRLVGDLQELSTAESGNLDYELALFDLSQLLRRETERAGGAAREGVTVTYDDSGSPMPVRADEMRISQVMRNLLSNAIRHTSSGSITVSARIEDSRVRVSVTDTGEGIGPDDLPHVFERFYRADSARAADTGGTGLGLAIMKRIVEDHGGRVFAESTSGAGTTVGFTLPLATDAR